MIGIDEAQFFDDLVDFCQTAADVDNKTIIVAGLDGDFLRLILCYNLIGLVSILRGNIVYNTL